MAGHLSADLHSRLVRRLQCISKVSNRLCLDVSPVMSEPRQEQTHRTSLTGIAAANCIAFPHFKVRLESLKQRAPESRHTDSSPVQGKAWASANMQTSRLSNAQLLYMQNRVRVKGHETDCRPFCPAQVYEHLVFEGSQHTSLRSLPGMLDRSFRIGSAGKTFSFTSWKVGGPASCTAAARLMSKNCFLSICVCPMWQVGVSFLPNTVYSKAHVLPE